MPHRYKPLLLFSLTLALFALPACTGPEVQSQGVSRTDASYSITTLTATLPEWVTPQAVAAAAEQTMRDRGYAVTSSVATTDSARVVGREPNAGAFKKFVVKGTWTRTGSKVTVSYEPIGDQVRSRALLDGVLARLGL